MLSGRANAEYFRTGSRSDFFNAEEGQRAASLRYAPIVFGIVPECRSESFRI